MAMEKANNTRLYAVHVQPLISFLPWEEGNMFELVYRACHTYMYMYMFGFKKPA